MIAFITGASSGLGHEFAIELAKRGYDLILVARRRDRLEDLKRKLATNVTVIDADLSDEKSCIEICKQLEDTEIDIAINNAGIGACGAFAEIDLLHEMQMVNLNIRAVHIFTKFFVKKFLTQKYGMIWNVASSAAFLPGPYMASYYATKAYVLRLSQAVRKETGKSGIKVCAFCPGPVKTEFDSVADVAVSLHGMDCRKAAQYGVKKLLKGKTVVIPGVVTKVSVFASKLLPDWILVRIAEKIQKSKLGGTVSDHKGI